jgi:hypothetical protein
MKDARGHGSNARGGADFFGRSGVRGTRRGSAIGFSQPTSPLGGAAAKKDGTGLRPAAQERVSMQMQSDQINSRRYRGRVNSQYGLTLAQASAKGTTPGAPAAMSLGQNNPS